MQKAFGEVTGNLFVLQWLIAPFPAPTSIMTNVQLCTRDRSLVAELKAVVVDSLNEFDVVKAQSLTSRLLLDMRDYCNSVDRHVEQCGLHAGRCVMSVSLCY